MRRSAHVSRRGGAAGAFHVPRSTLKELTGTVVVQVWDKDEDDTPLMPFSSKFWKDETDDFLGMLTFKVEDILAHGYEVRATATGLTGENDAPV